MELQSFQYTVTRGWSVDQFPNRDSENTLVLIFAAPEFIDNPGPIHELVAHYPTSKIIGCSSAGEIAGVNVNDHSLSVAVVKFKNTPLEITSIPLGSVTDSCDVGEKIVAKLNRDDL